MLTGGISVDVGEMQTKLSRWAEEDKTRIFDDVFNLLYDEDWLRTAQAHVKQNAGSRTAGCDGIVMRHFEENLEGNLKRLQKTSKPEGSSHNLCDERTSVKSKQAAGSRCAL
jgi:retron-type reverse transcriptase